MRLSCHCPSRSPVALMAPMTLTIAAIGRVTLAGAHPLAMVPEAERLPCHPAAADGVPTSNAGVTAVHSLGSQPLGGDFSALHRHDSRPGVAYLLEGRLTERRGPAYRPVVLQAGEAAFDTTGVSQLWRNETSAAVWAIVVVIVEASTP